MNHIQEYANYIAKANSDFANNFGIEDPKQTEIPVEAVVAPVIDPDPEVGIRISLSAPLAATKNGKGYLKILVHLTNVASEGDTFPEHGVSTGFDYFHFKITGGPKKSAQLTRSALLTTGEMSIFSANNKVGAWMPQDRQDRTIAIREDGIICGFQWSDIPSGKYTINLSQFNIGNGRWNDEYEGVGGQGHHPEFWPNVPTITVNV